MRQLLFYLTFVKKDFIIFDLELRLLVQGNLINIFYKISFDFIINVI